MKKICPNKRQTDRKTDRQTVRQTDRQRQKETEDRSPEQIHCGCDEPFIEDLVMGHLVIGQ